MIGKNSIRINNLPDISTVVNESEQILQQELGKLSGIELRRFLLSQKPLIISQLSKIQEIKDNYKRRLQKVQSYELQIPHGEQETEQLYRRWIAAKEEINSDTTIAQTMKEGYSLLDQIRTTILGSPMTYWVGLYSGRGKNKVLVEGNLTMQEILNIAYGTGIWKSTEDSFLKLRLSRASLNKSGLKDKLNIHVQSDMNYSFFSRVQQIGNNIGVTNTGNQFETYRNLSVNRKRLDRITGTQIRSELVSVTKNTFSWIKGGDRGDESIKFFDSDPSLTTLTTLETSFSLIGQLIEQASSNISLLERGVKIAFTKTGSSRFKSGGYQSGLNEEMRELFKQLSNI